MAECPACAGQVMSCGCRFDEDGDWHEDERDDGGDWGYDGLLGDRLA